MHQLVLLDYIFLSLLPLAQQIVTCRVHGIGEHTTIMMAKYSMVRWYFL